MKRLCFGTVITILHQAKAQSVTVPSIVNKTIQAFGASIGNYYEELPKHLKSGKNNIPPEVIETIRRTSESDAYKGVADCIVRLVKSGKEETVIRAIKAVLKEDDSITPRTVIGYGEGYEKSNILESDTFNFCELLANVLYYVCVNVDNRACADAIKEIDSKFVSSFAENGEPVYFELPGAIVEPQLQKTVRGDDFGKTFNHIVNGFAVDKGNPATVDFYCAEIGNCQIQFDKLGNYLLNHIGEYVMSRVKVSRMEQEGHLSTLGLQGFFELMKSSNHKGEWDANTLGEILLYLFLEEVLDAPKIMSKVEVKGVSGVTESKCDGVHLLTRKIDGIPFRELVFGASDIIGDIRTAIDRAFSKVIAIKGNKSTELRMVENTTMNRIFDPETTKFMESIIFPDSAREEKPEISFGVFLGYTLGVDPEGLSGREFKSAAYDKIKADIGTVKPYIATKIREMGLGGYSFYFYVLPFNVAEKECTSILEDAFSGGM